MRQHRREPIVRAAENELRGAIIDIIEKHQLTDAEALAIVAAALGGHVGSVAKYAIRMERHGDPNKPGGLEDE